MKANLALLPLFLFSLSLTLGCASKIQQPENWWTKHTGKIVKVYSVSEGDAVYRAYVVTWAGQEIAIQAAPDAGQKVYEVGDVVTFSAYRIYFGPPVKRPSITFTIEPEFRNRN